MPSRLTLACSLALCLVPAGAFPSFGQEPGRTAPQAKDIESLLRTDWYGLYLKGTKIGYFRSSRERSGDFIREAETFSMKLSSFGRKSEVVISQVTTFENAAPYRMVRAEMDQRSGAAPSEGILLVRKDKGFDYTYRT